MTALAAVIVAFLSASQDIVIDAYRIEYLPQDEQGHGAAPRQVGYRFGLLASGAGALFVAGIRLSLFRGPDLRPRARDRRSRGRSLLVVTFITMAAMMVVGVVTTAMREPPNRRPPGIRDRGRGRICARLVAIVMTAVAIVAASVKIG